MVVPNQSYSLLEIGLLSIKFNQVKTHHQSPENMDCDDGKMTNTQMLQIILFVF